MSEVFPLYIIALSAVAMAVGTFVNLVLLISVRRMLKKRHHARTQFHREIGGRVHRIERYLVKQVRASQPLSMEKPGSKPRQSRSYGGTA